MVDFLLTNDDGVDAEGLRRLSDALAPLGTRTIVAPAHNQSGRSQAITFSRPLTATPLPTLDDVSRTMLDGTPADAVKFGLQYIYRDTRPTLLVSGINHGLNCGASSLYSGTLGAALEANACGVSSVAVSVRTGENHAVRDWEAVEYYTLEAVRIALALEAQRQAESLPQKPFCLSVNVPFLPHAEIKGLRVTRHGLSGYQEYFAPDENGTPNTYQMHSRFENDDPDETYDTAAIAAGYVSLTPVQLTRTDTTLWTELAARHNR